jgi:uncharacterized protein (TIRG00374 family)
MKNKKSLFIGIAIGLVCLGIWIYLLDFEELKYYLQKINLFYLLPFSLFYIFAYLLRSIRWKIIINPIYRMSIWEAFAYFMSGMLINYLIPIRAGEIAKSVFLKKNKDVNISYSLPTIFVDKLTDLSPIILIIVLVPILRVQLNEVLIGFIVAIFVLYLIFISVLIFSMKNRKLMHKILMKVGIILPKRFEKRLESFFYNFVDGMNILKGRAKDTSLTYLLTFVAALSEGFFIYMIFKGLGYSQNNFIHILFGYTLMNLTYIFPTPPAQIGSNEFMWVVIFSFALGIDKNLTGAAVAIAHILTGLIIFLFGAISLSMIGKKLSDVFHTEVSEETRQKD